MYTNVFKYIVKSQGLRAPNTRSIEISMYLFIQMYLENVCTYILGYRYRCIYIYIHVYIFQTQWLRQTHVKCKQIYIYQYIQMYFENMQSMYISMHICIYIYIRINI